MAENSSSSDLHHETNHSSHPPCQFPRQGLIITVAPLLTNIFILPPLCIFVLYHGFQQWRKNSSASTMSHSDCFSYHMATMELVGVFGCIVRWSYVYKKHHDLLYTAEHLVSFTWYGQMFFHILTCVERYLAVVHPITYLGLRKERGVRMRNITIGWVWLLCFVRMSLEMKEEISHVVDLSLMILFLMVISFCSLSVLYHLIRPGLGGQGGNRERVNQSKQRAFYTIVAILGVLVLRFIGDLTATIFYTLEGSGSCLAKTCEVWLELPSALVLPLLFVHKKAKLMH